MPDKTIDCKECANWEKVKDRVRVHTVFTSLMNKMESKVTSDDFKPTTGDLLKVWDAVKTLELADEGSKETTVQWVDQPVESKA